MAQMAQVQRVPSPEPQAMINTASGNSRVAQAEGYSEQGGLISTPAADDAAEALERLFGFATAEGDISSMLDPGVVSKMGNDAVTQWETDDASRAGWKEMARRALADAAQEDSEDDDSQPNDEGLWHNSADIRYPLLTTASQQFAARAGPELIKGDQVVGVKVFAPPAPKPTAGQIAEDAPKPQTPEGQQIVAQGLQQAQQQANQAALVQETRRSRAERVKHYLNWTIFYKMDDWEGETDLLLHQIPITGAAFKKVYMGSSGLCSDYVSALRLTVHNDTKSIYRCPRITEDFEVYPYEIAERQASGIYRDDVELPNVGPDPERPRKFIEQHRMEDLDGDGLAEPYVITVDVEQKAVMRIEPAYTLADIMVRDSVDPKTGEAKRRVSRIDRWQAYAAYLFLPDPRGRFYGIGFGRLLESITSSVDTTINQLLDAGTAEIAGGGFIASGVRLQGSGQGGVITQQPGEFLTVGAPGNDLKAAIWERTVPHPSAVSMQLLEFLLAAAKDVASVKDVVTGDAPNTAPVGTTLALQNQALQVFSAIYKRVYRGFRDEFRLMYRAIRRWKTDEMRQEYKELTGGDLDDDFSGDGTDIQPIADPAVVTKMQKIARLQTVAQIADSPLGEAAGMTQPKQAQEIVGDMLDVLEIDRPDRYVGDVPPNPLAIAKAQETAASAQLKGADAELRQVQAQRDRSDAEVRAKLGNAAAGLDQARALREVGLAAQDTHALHQEADRVARHGMVATPDQLIDPADEAEKDRLADQEPSEGENDGVATP